MILNLLARLLAISLPVAPSPSCYLKGTNIRTANGESAVEALKIGTLITLHDGSLAPVKWVGRMTFRKRSQLWQRRILPVRIAQGALGDNLPARDLHVSQKHMMFVAGHLVKAKHLINGSTIRLAALADANTLEYYHVAVEGHSALLAEGQPAETLRSSAIDRERFENFAEYAKLYPNDKPARPKAFAPVRHALPSFGLRKKTQARQTV